MCIAEIVCIAEVCEKICIYLYHLFMVVCRGCGGVEELYNLRKKSCSVSLARQQQGEQAVAGVALVFKNLLGSM